MRITKRLMAVFVSLTMALQISIPSTSAMALEPDTSGQVSAYTASASKQSATASQDPAGLGEGPSISESTSADESASKDSASQEDSSDLSEEPSSEQPSNQKSAVDESAPAEEAAVQAEAEPQPQAAVAYDVRTVDDLIQKLAASGTATAAATVTPSADGKTAASINATDPAKTLIVLSHTEPSIYSAAEISLSNTGNGVDLTGAAQIGSGTSAVTWSFDGLGSEGAPFAGSMTKTNFRLAHTLFNGVDVSDRANTEYELTWAIDSIQGGGASTTDPMFASFVKSNGGSLAVTATLLDGSDYSYATWSPLIGLTEGDLSLNSMYRMGSTLKKISVQQVGNAGMLVDTVKAGTLTLAGFTGDGLEEANVTSSNGSAGYLVGQVMGGAALTLDCEVAAPNGAIKSALSSSESAGYTNNPGAGGLVGKVETGNAQTAQGGGKVTINKPINVENLSIGGYIAGGFVGRAKFLTLIFGEEGKISPALSVGQMNAGGSNAEGIEAGALFGEVLFQNEQNFNANHVQLNSEQGYSLNAQRYVGGLFGVLGFPGQTYTASPTVAVCDLTVKSSQWANKNGSSGCGSGGIVGSLSWDGVAGKLVVRGVSIEYSCSQGWSLGGVVGTFWGSGILVADKLSVKASLPDSGSIQNKFGGVVGNSADGNGKEISVFANDLSLSTDGGKNISKGGGVVGYAGNSLRLRLSGATDLSGVVYDSSSSAGQIVGEQNGSLIFATGSGSDDGWKFKRGSQVELNDIGNYGEIVRLGGGLGADFIKLDESNGAFSLNNGELLQISESGYSIDDVKDFALFALTWQTRGKYSGIDGVNANNWNSITSSTLNFAGDVNLLGTGITGLSRDNLSNEDAFTGTINGGGHKVELAIGEPYGMRGDNSISQDDETLGNGKTYHHNALGLVAKGNGNISNLTIEGFIKFKSESNCQAYVGGYAAVNDAGSVKIASSTFNPSITFSQSSSSDRSAAFFAGNVFGALQGSGNTVTFGDGCKVAASMEEPTSKTSNEGVGLYSYAGAVVGYVSGASTVEVKAESLEVSGQIKASTSSDALPMGGFIGFIDQAQKANSSFKKVDIAGIALKNLTLDLGSNNAVGGFLGYSWAQTDVAISGSDRYAITTENSTLKANGAKSVGGLVYRAGGKWAVGDKAISLNGATIESVSGGDNGRLGLLVCRGGRGSEEGAVGKYEVSSLYLESTAEWGNSYELEGLNLSSIAANIFDEWVADTCETSSEDVYRSNVNGVVSLHTSGDAKNALNMDGNVSSCNSYKNRTVYGGAHQENKYGRYYYNLEKNSEALGSNGNNSGVTTPEGLLLWSVYNYIDSNIRGRYFPNCDSWEIKGSFDMEGYSYYPIDLCGRGINISGSSFTFYNEQIEAEESGNKLTSSDSQHKGMHCGLLRNVNTNTSNQSISASSIAFAGSVGKLDGSSGAFICGEVAGSTAGSTVYTYTVKISGCKLDGIKVAGFTDSTDEYAPLLLGSTSSASSLDVSAVSISSDKYEGGKAVATSLIGNVGNKDASRVSATFGTISLPSKQSDKVFSKATLLNAFSYSDAGSAIYNFTAEDKDSGQVTYGREIDNNGNAVDKRPAQYLDEQLWYYNADHVDQNRVQDGSGTSSVVAGANNFESYLPYVAVAYNTSSRNYEIEVNHQITDIVSGCGTYGHPYEITSKEQFSKVAEAVNGDGNFSGTMKVRVVLDQEALCTETVDGTGTNDIELTLTNGSFVGQKADGSELKISSETMRTYFRSAYYSIESDIILTDFAGLGVDSEHAFRGVIVGNGGSITINKQTATTYGLIRYSYGSVVKDLDIAYQGLPNGISYEAPSDYIPKSFFGGVIGCVLGGDNIIDGVSVNSGLGFLVSGADGSAKDTARLVPVGGYVGVVAGGGVIFRNASNRSSALSSWHLTSVGAYDNPYLGRMLDGYAFSEGCEVDNGSEDSNYKINQITPSITRDIETSEYSYDGKQESGTTSIPYISSTISVNNAQGLLVLSGIINSGAAAGPVGNESNGQNGTRAYLGLTSKTSEDYSFGNQKYGKVRNAKYSSVGLADGSDDWATAKDDDLKAPGIQDSVDPSDASSFNGAIASANTPYLVTAYANRATAYVCASSSRTTTCIANFKFADNAVLDMTKYGSGYLGLSARYVTNAALQNVNLSGSSVNEGYKYTYSVNPQIGSIDGGGATLKVCKNEQEYANDDFHTLGVGGLFCTAGFITPLNTDPNSYQILKNLTISDSTVSLSYYDAESLNNVMLSNNTQQNQRLRSIVGVGGVAGILSPESSSYNGGQVENVAVDKTKITSPATAGSLFGMAAYALRATDESSVKSGVFAYADGGSDIKGMTMRLKDCSYSNLDIEADRWAGGFFGNLTTFGENSGFYVSEGEAPVGLNSRIHSNGKYVDMGWDQSNTYAGGLVGYAKANFQVNSFDNLETKTLKMVDVEVSNDYRGWNGLPGTGGLIGYYERPQNCGVKNVEIKSSDLSAMKSIGGVEGDGSNPSNNVGGLIGRSSYLPNGSLEVQFNFSNCVIDGMRVVGTNYVGGLIGQFDNRLVINVNGICIRNCDIGVNRAGGLVGFSNNSNAKINVADTKLVANDFRSGMSLGGLMGQAKAEQHWSNILLQGNVYGDVRNQGVLIGDASECVAAYVAGLDIELTGNQTTSGSLPSTSGKTVYFRNAPSGFDSKSYISFANYTNTEWDNADSAKVLAQETAYDPYVNVVPVSGVELASNDSGIDGYLFGDGMNPQLGNPNAGEGAASIVRDAKKADAQAGKFLYKEFSAENCPVTENNMSTIAAENNRAVGGEEGQYAKDFPVLLVSSGQDAVIESYLDAITNGGYSSAKACNNTANEYGVTATAEPYKYDGNGKLVVDDSGRRASVDVRDAGTTNMKFVVTSGYDNTLDRISLITVKFTAATGQKHMVYVPVVVRRMVQVDFTATMVEGTDFNKADYSALGENAHVLAAYGDTVTALLTYAYNNELGEYKEYDWNGHLSAGGNMGPVDKTIKFGSSSGSQGNYPAGTQLTLVDCQNGNKMYKYEVPEGESTSSLNLSEFKDSSGASYEPAWMSDLMGVSAKLSTGGAWIECDKANATASGKYEGETKYFRVVNAETDKDSSKYYELSVDDAQKAPSENFYLVVRFPESSTGSGLNGYLDSSVSLAVPSRINNKLRPSNERDSQSNTASTYNILSGYSQDLTDNANELVTTLYQNTSDYSFSMNVTDTISFAAGQLSNDNDKLYYQLGASLGLMSYSSSGGETLQSATGFPSGTTGKVEFRVHDDSGNYFKWGVMSDGSHSWIPAEKDGVAVSYPWESDGNDMKLTLGTSSNAQDAVSLHGLRNGRNSITIDAVMEVHMTDEAHSAGIAAALAPDQGEDRPDSYTKLLYRGVLTTNNSRFDSSNAVASITGNHGYYRNESGSSSISFIASKPSQLGINLDDLASADGTIAAVGTYDLSKLNGSAALIQKADKVEYKLSLQKRTGTNDDGSGKYDDVDIGDYVKVTSAESEEGIQLGSREMGSDIRSYTWTDDGLKTLSGGSRQFKLKLNMKVDTTKDKHTYANYRLVLEAKLIDSDGKVLNSPTNTSDYITYTLTRVNTKGIHE